MNIWKCSTVALAIALGLVVSSGLNVSSASADSQPRMQDALAHLERAEESLEKASTDKGGFRVKALASTRTALKQVRDGIKFDNKNDNEKDKAQPKAAEDAQP